MNVMMHTVSIDFLQYLLLGIAFVKTGLFFLFIQQSADLCLLKINVTQSERGQHFPFLAKPANVQYSRFVSTRFMFISKKM